MLEHHGNQRMDALGHVLLGEIEGLLRGQGLAWKRMSYCSWLKIGYPMSYNNFHSYHYRFSPTVSLLNDSYRTQNHGRCAVRLLHHGALVAGEEADGARVPAIILYLRNIDRHSTTVSHYRQQFNFLNYRLIMDNGTPQPSEINR